MDIRKNRNYHAFNIKYFTITAIASAVLACHANIAKAASCPIEITGTASEGLVCDFDTHQSVTVENGGTAGGIRMNGYNPGSSSFVTINAGGTVSNAAGVAISILNSSLSNGFSNFGTISSASNTGVLIGSGSNISGGVSNSGLISAGGPGILVSSSTINGGISNSGTISSASGDSIRVSSTSVVNGGISNSGTISSTNGAGIQIVSSSLINSGISNSGTINSTNGTGILIKSNSTVNSGITNSGMIKGSGSDDGIAITNHSTINNGFTNNGLIEASDNGDSILIRSSSLNGGISNNGTIKSVSGDGIAVSNVSTIQDNIFNSGIISGGHDGILIRSGSTLNGNISNDGTISGGNAGIAISSATINGSLSNSGKISGTSTGIFVTSSTISGGITNSGTIQGGTFAININSSSAPTTINIDGQSARIIGAVEAQGATVNITAGAIFTSEGTYHVDIFNVDSNALFNMRNTITANAVNNAGTLSVGNTAQTIVGNYTQNTGGIFQIGATSTTNYGQLAVSGAVDLSQSGNINVQIASNTSLKAGDVLSNVISGNTLITPTNGFNVTDNSFLWKFTANLNSTSGVDLTASINPAANNACQGDYCQGAATTIINQVAAGNAAFGPYAALSTENAFAAAASQATPELTNENVQVTQLVTQSVMDIVPMWSTLHGASAGDEMLYQPGKVWFKPYVGTMTQNQSNSVPGFDATAYGMVVGKDMQINTDWLLGGALAIGRDNMSGKDVLDEQTINSNDYQGIIYAARTLPHNLYFAGQGLIGYGDNNTKRVIPVDSSTADGSYNSWFTNLRAQLGWNVYELNQSLVLTPEVDASYLFINQGSYQETGSPMDLSVDSSNNSSLVLGAYGHGALRLTTLSNKQDLTLTAYVGAARNVLNSQPETTAVFIAGGPSFTTPGVQLNSTVFRGGVGLAFANPTKPFKMNLNYDLQSGNNAYSGVGSVTIAYQI